MAGAEEKIVRKREREPITMVCFVVFLVASVAVIGAYVNSNYISKNGETVQYGDTVELDYTGSLYGYYDEATDSVKPIIFDTSIEKIGKDREKYLFTSSFSKTEFNTLTTTLGKGKTLAYFDSMLIGKKVGETVRFMVAAADAYSKDGRIDYNSSVNAVTFNLSKEGVTAAEISKYYGIEEESAGTSFELFGIPISVIPDGTGKYTVTVNVIGGQNYVIMDSALGKVTMTTAVAGSVATCTFNIENPVYVKDKDGNNVEAAAGINMIEMLSFNIFFNQNLNIIGFDGTNIIYNNASGDAQIGGMDLYFEVKIVKKN